MSPVEREILHLWYDQLSNHHSCSLKVEPDLIVYLQTSPEVAWRRTQKRGRPEEMSVDVRYMRSLAKMHDRVLVDEVDIIPGTVLVLNGNTDRVHMAPLYSQVKNKIEEIQKRKWEEQKSLNRFMSNMEGENKEARRKRRERAFKTGRVYIAGHVTSDEDVPEGPTRQVVTEWKPEGPTRQVVNDWAHEGQRQVSFDDPRSTRNKAYDLNPDGVYDEVG
jgi:broad-specificity NMP kinase